jgi:hypothetical protein
METSLKLVTLYDATRNERTLFRHNLTTDGANDAGPGTLGTALRTLRPRSARKAFGGGPRST